MYSYVIYVSTVSTVFEYIFGSSLISIHTTNENV